MERIAKMLAGILLALGIVWSASADDDPKISFEFNLELVTVSITGIDMDALYDEETKNMLKRAAQLVHYSAKQMRWQKEFPRCLRHSGDQVQGGGGFVFSECAEWEK